MNKTNKLARTAAAMAISVATGLLAAPVDAVSPTVTYALDTTSVPTLGVPIPKEMRGGTWKVIYSSAEGPEGRPLQ